LLVFEYVVEGQLRLQVQEPGEAAEEGQLIHAEVLQVVAVFCHELVGPPDSCGSVVREVPECELVAAPVGELDRLPLVVIVDRVQTDAAEEAPLPMNYLEVLPDCP